MGLRVVVACAVLACFAACQPLYGDKPEKLHNPDKKKRPPEADPKAEPVKYVDECTASFQDDPKKWQGRINPLQSKQLVEQGDTADQGANKAKDDKAKISLILDALQRYKDALVKDPYNAEATLKLALEYDKLLRKGCAIAMLKRLVALSNNPKFARAAIAQIDSIGDNAGWFKGYRKDAMSAVGR
jgi:hypothetical protein